MRLLVMYWGPGLLPTDFMQWATGVLCLLPGCLGLSAAQVAAVVLRPGPALPCPPALPQV